MKSRIHLWGLILASLVLSSCMNSGAFISSNNTTVELSEANYEIAATNVEGMSEAQYVFGFTYSHGILTQSLSVARIGGSTFLYQDALDNLWQNYKTDHGDVQGEKLALTNVRYDANVLNLFFYNKIQLSVRADVVKFTD